MTSFNNVEKFPKASVCIMFIQSEKALGSPILRADTTMISFSANATRWRSWSCPCAAFTKNCFCTKRKSSFGPGVL